MNNLKTIKKTHIEFIIQFTLAIILVALAGVISIHESQNYYSVAPFHFDSAYYLLNALHLHELVNTHGRLFAFLQEIKSHKDFLDVCLRILLAPEFLKTTYGHMAVTLPFMGLFAFLTVHYVFKRTQLWLASLVVVSFIFCFPFIYTPYTGMADYWKESIAIWMLGSAAFSWLLSNMLERPLWSLLCSTLLGLLVMERTALAVYSAFIFIPPFCLAAYHRLHNDKMKTALLRISAFILPAGLLSSVVAFTQWEILYTYYFVAGYDYKSPLYVAKFLLWMIIHFIRFPVFFIMIIYCFCFYIITDWKQERRDVSIAAWFVIGLPLIITLTHGMYTGFYNVWIVFLITLLATVIPRRSSSLFKDNIFYTMLLIMIIGNSAVQFLASKERTTELVKKFTSMRTFFDTVTDVILTQPRPYYVSFLFAEDSARFFDHWQLNRGLSINTIEPVGYMSAHDTYYKIQSKFDDPKQIAKENIRQLEHNEHTLAVTYCDSKEVEKSPAFAEDGRKKAIPVVAYQTDYLLNSKHWQALKKLDSPYGCVYVYKYSKTPLTKLSKWQSIRIMRVITRTTSAQLT